MEDSLIVIFHIALIYQAALALVVYIKAGS